MDKNRQVSISQLRQYLTKQRHYIVSAGDAFDRTKIVLLFPFVFIGGMFSGATPSYHGTSYKANKMRKELENKQRVTVTIRKKGFFEDNIW